MDVSDLRKRILGALDDARKQSVVRRQAVDEAGAAYETFLSTIATPLIKQAMHVLKGEGQPFVMHTPAGHVRLASESSPDTFVEFELDATSATPQVIGRTSLSRGRDRHVVEERPVAPGKGPAETSEDDVAKFLVQEIPKLVMRT
jgi:hypothetical protein